jgi:4-amino-4-deoxy-L-arabinose transferase-like glycosyltransferase
MPSLAWILTPSLPARRSTVVVLAAILAVAATVRFWGLDFGLPHTQARPDETHIIDVTLYFLRGNFKPPFYDYPWLYMWVLTGLYLCYFVWGVATGMFHTVADLVASWPTHWEPFFLISRALSATCGVATVFIVYRLGRRLWDEATGLIAAFFLSLAFLHARDSHFGTTDAAMTMLIAGAVALLITAHQSGQRSLYALAGVVAGLAAATKYNAIFVPLVMAASQIVRAVDAPGRRLRTIFDERLLWFGLPFAAGFSVGIPFVVLDFERFRQAMADLRNSMEQGTGYLDLESGWLHHVKLSLRYGLGLPLLVAGVAGAVLIAAREPRIAALLLTFPLAYYLVAGSVRNLFFRYVIPMVPFLCLTAARLVAVATDRFVSQRAFRPAVLTAAASAIVLPSAIGIWHFDRIIAQPDNRVVVARWFADNVPAGSSVLQSGSPFGYAQLDNRTYKVWVWDRFRRRFMVNGMNPTGRPDWILVQDSPLPSATQDIVRDLLREDYQFAWQFTALSLKAEHVYDQQDAFFVPFAGFKGVTRPGPNFSLYKRSTASYRNGPPSAQP